MKTVRIATRGSQLALWQAHAVRDALQASHAGLAVEVLVVRTTGDRILDVPLARIGDRGLFTKELDEALLGGEAELAVHSLKDVPTRLPEGLSIAAVTRREDPRDVIVLRAPGVGGLAGLAQGARVGTSSLRRRAQLRNLRPDLQVLDLRGNLNTRLAKLDAGEYDAIVLAAAGMLRLGWSERISEYLPPARWLPAVGQGALGIVARSDDAATHELLQPLHDAETAACVAAERALLRALEGGCQVPIGALAEAERGGLTLHGLVADLDGRAAVRDALAAPAEHAEELGQRLAEKLLQQGGAEILADVRAAFPGPVPPAAAP